jgi:serine/threonine-protein kinase
MSEMIGKKLGGCTIESKIGQGGMGTVYKALHETLNIPVAIKVFHGQDDSPESKERFLREAQLMAQLRHPNIVAVMNAGIEDGTHYIIMEYVDGGNLLSLINNKKVIPFQEAIGIAIDILKALRIAKEHSIVHRDIKPENILIDKLGNAKLADLGLARAINSERLTQSNVMLGSPHYIAPEQANNSSNVDYRSDIYSLGCTLFHMLSGKEPFPGGSLIEIVVNHTQKPVPSLIGLDSRIPQYLSDIVYKMMQKDPDNRYSDPSNVINALLQKISEEAEHVALKVPSSSRRTKISPVALGLGAIVILLLTIIVGFSLKKERGSEVATIPKPDTTAVHSDTIKTPQDSSRTQEVKKPKNVKKAILKAQIDLSSSVQPQENQENPLISIVKIGDTEGLRNMLQKGVSPKCEPGSPTTPLHEAVRRGLTIETQLLVKNGAPTNVLDKNGNSPLHYAIKENASLLVKTLLENGADPNLKTRNGKTPLEMAQSIDSELESLLEKYGAK